VRLAVAKWLVNQTGETAKRDCAVLSSDREPLRRVFTTTEETLVRIGYLLAVAFN
jgi:hypothetical protein